MTLETSGETAGANQQPHLAAAMEKEPPALASPNSKLNGLSYNEAMVEDIPFIPSRGQRRWLTVVAEWKFIAAILAPFGVAIALYFIPATKGELQTIQKEAAASLEVVKAANQGQTEALKAQIGALQLVVSDTKTDVKEMRSDIKEAIKLLQNHITAPPEPYVAAASPPQDNPPSTRRVKKKTVQPIAAKPASGFRLW